jgi:hypothetical protein
MEPNAKRTRKRVVITSALSATLAVLLVSIISMLLKSGAEVGNVVARGRDGKNAREGVASSGGTEHTLSGPGSRSSKQSVELARTNPLPRFRPGTVEPPDPVARIAPAFAQLAVPGIVKCYKPYALKDPNLKGHITFKFKLRRDGEQAKVVDATIEPPDPTLPREEFMGAPPAMQLCVLQAITEVRFPPPPPGIDEEFIEYPFQFGGLTPVGQAERKRQLEAEAAAPSLSSGR